jgi:uncharacterized damage-inducible protein DinB
MEFQYEDALAILRRTPATLTRFLSGLPETWTESTEGPDTWSVFDIVGHLLHGDETDWIPRIRVIVEYGEKRPFDSFNRTAMFEDYQGYSLEQLLEAFAEARARNLATLDEIGITPPKLALTGTHPTLGRVTLSQLLSTWVVHDLNHMGQIVEVMAHQYAEAVGPWSAYLGILTRPILTE